MKRTGCTIEGLDAFDRNLEAIGAVMTNVPTMTGILLDRIEPVAERARELVHVRTGRLQRSITTSDRCVEPEPGITVYVGPSADIDYGDDVEIGRPDGIAEDGTNPHPYMRPAWDEESDRILPGVATDIGSAIARAIKA